LGDLCDVANASLDVLYFGILVEVVFVVWSAVRIGFLRLMLSSQKVCLGFPCSPGNEI
jgi:hypothetical protein